MNETEQRYNYTKHLIESASKAYVVENIKNLGINIEDIKKESYLFKFMTQILSGQATDETKSLWKNYEKAYYELKEKNLLSFSFVEQYEKQFEEFKVKATGSCLIPLAELEKAVIEKKQYGKTSVEIDYGDFTDLFEQYYGIKTRGFFDKFTNSNNGLFSVEDTEKFRNMKPSEDYRSAMLSIVYEIECDARIYADFWHYLLGFDFSQVHNGCNQTMWIDYAEWDDDEEEDEGVHPERLELKNRLFDLIRKAYFKEAAQIPFYQGNIPKSINFWISW